MKHALDITSLTSTNRHNLGLIVWPERLNGGQKMQLCTIHLDFDRTHFYREFTLEKNASGL